MTIKYEGGGRSTEPARLDEKTSERTSETENRDKIIVEDTGKGISAQHLERLFERSYRVDRARSREMGGTGLGLAIVKHLARAHGGEVTVTSELGKGSVFTIELPGNSIVNADKSEYAFSLARSTTMARKSRFGQGVIINPICHCPGKV